MTKEQFEKLVDIVIDSDEDAPIKAVCYTLFKTFDELLQDKGSSLYYIKEELGDRVAKHLVRSVISSVIGSLYCSTHFETPEDAQDFIKNMGVDKVVVEEPDIDAKA